MEIERITMAIEYYYKLTGNKGKNLFASLRQEDYDRLEDESAEMYAIGAIPGGDWRMDFIDEHLWGRLNGDDLDTIVNSVPVLQRKPNNDVREWLYKNKCPFPEEDSIQEWGAGRARWDSHEGLFWECIDRKNDVETALCFGLVSYPKRVDGKYIEDNTRTAIPAKTADEISRLCDKRNNEPLTTLPDYKWSDGISKEISRLEQEAFEKLILISGFYCTIHGGKTDFEQPIPKSEVLTCPTCGHPVCSECANMYVEEPDTEEKAREYVESCSGVSGMAQCGCCGDYSEGFMLNYLKLIKCPIPKEYLDINRTPTQRDVVYVSTPSVMQLQDFPDISTKVKKKFECGASGIINVEHPTGEIWGIPEKHPANWVVTICYPHER